MYYAHSAAGIVGSGTYLFRLPGNYQFNTAVHPLNTQVDLMSGVLEFRKVIPATGFIQAGGTIFYNNTAVVPHSQNQFKFQLYTNAQFVRAGYFSLNATDIVYKLAFRFKKAN